MTNKVRLICFVVFAITSGIGLMMAISNFQESGKELDIAKAEQEQAEKDLAYAYGECVFYYEQSVEFCNAASHDKGLPLYEKYYGNGSWTVK